MVPGAGGRGANREQMCSLCARSVVLGGLGVRPATTLQKILLPGIQVRGQLLRCHRMAPAGTLELAARGRTRLRALPKLGRALLSPQRDRLLHGALVLAAHLLLLRRGLVCAELIRLEHCSLMRAQTLLLAGDLMGAHGLLLLHHGVTLSGLLQARDRGGAFSRVLLSDDYGAAIRYLLLLDDDRRTSRDFFLLLLLRSDLVRTGGLLRSDLRGALVLLGDGAGFRHCPCRVRPKTGHEGEEWKTGALHRHVERVLRPTKSASAIFTPDQAKKGLCRLSSPMVVSGPWPGQITVSSLRVKISARFVASAAA